MSDLESALAAGISTYADLDIDETAFATHLQGLVARQRSAGADAQGPPLAGLVVADLYLAFACECGIEAAWEVLQERFLVALTRRALRCRVGAVRAEAQAVALLGDLALPPPRGDSRTLIGTYDGSGTLLGWMSVILVRRLFRHTQRPAHHPLQARDAAQAQEPRTGQRAPQAWQHAANAETADRLRQGMSSAWSSMSDHEILVVVFKHGHGIKQRRIARMLGLSEPTCSRLAASALAKVKAHVLRALGGDAIDRVAESALWRELEQVVAARIGRTVVPDAMDGLAPTSHNGEDR